MFHFDFFDLSCSLILALRLKFSGDKFWRMSVVPTSHSCHSAEKHFNWINTQRVKIVHFQSLPIEKSVKISRIRIVEKYFLICQNHKNPNSLNFLMTLKFICMTWIICLFRIFMKLAKHIYLHIYYFIFIRRIFIEKMIFWKISLF